MWRQGGASRTRRGPSFTCTHRTVRHTHTHTHTQSPEVHLLHQCMLCKLYTHTHTHIVVSQGTPHMGLLSQTRRGRLLARSTLLHCHAHTRDCDQGIGCMLTMHTRSLSILVTHTHAGHTVVHECLFVYCRSHIHGHASCMQYASCCCVCAGRTHLLHGVFLKLLFPPASTTHSGVHARVFVCTGRTHLLHGVFLTGSLILLGMLVSPFNYNINSYAALTWPMWIQAFSLVMAAFWFTPEVRYLPCQPHCIHTLT